MKKKIVFIILFALAIFFISFNNVQASVLATCEYNAPYTSESYMKFQIIINDDKTAESYYYAGDIKDYKNTNDAKLLLMPAIFKTVGSTDSYANEIGSYITSESIINIFEAKGNTCPNIITSINGASSSVTVSDEAVVDGVMTMLATITKEEYTEDVPPQVTKTKTCTSHYKKGTMAGVDGAEFNFNQYSDGKREFCVRTATMSLASCTSFKKNDYPALHVITSSGAEMAFTLSKETIDQFYTETCIGDQFYIYEEAGIGMGSYVLTTSSEEANEGTAVAPGEEGELSEKNNLKFTPTQLCTSADNCNIDLTNFCAMPPVTRTLKFIGLLFTIAKILVPAIIIIMGIVNLVKIITSGKEEEVKKGVKSIFVRAIIGVGIFLLPGIISWVFTVASDIISQGEPSKFVNCTDCIFDPTNPEKCVVTTDN